ncbi:MAG: DUF3108 domain-containing protein [Kiritimatiellae bacterium]|nr:DUF3108 domain-containing protein [Kiritimatiellia bacterium]MDW8459210.1 DUF3108 domain-containing protein [Verrucomicrobiota bacterium]
MDPRSRPYRSRIRLSAIRLFGALLAVFAQLGAGHEPPFPVGESLRARLTWGRIPVGEAMIESEWTDDQPPLIRLRVHVRSNAFLDRFYRIDDVVESIVDPTTFLPIRFEKRLQEGGSLRHDITFYNREEGRVFWHNLLVPERRDFPAPRDIRDILSLMYSLRSADFRPGQTNWYVVSGDEGIITVGIDVNSHQTFEHPRYGRIPAYFIRPIVGNDPLFLGRIPRQLWISSDPPYVLLRLSVEAPVGRIHLTLDEILGHPRGPWPYRSTGSSTDSHADR